MLQDAQLLLEMQYIFLSFMLCLWLVVFKVVQVTRVISLRLGDLGSETFCRKYPV